MRRLLLALGFFFLCSAAFALSFPELTGRVVDDAHVLSPATSQSLDQTLAAFEQESDGDQVVVATIPSLQGTTIEDYGYQLGRHWGIGQKGKDNGVVLIVAPNERKVRIEVGYGLEATLTDALSSEIIQGIILPDFRQGSMEKGVTDGTYAIVAALGGKTSLQGHSVSAPTQSSRLWPVAIFIIFIILRMFILPWWFPLFFPLNSRGGFGGGGSFSSGGFSGGGGSFGGGGASGGW